MMLHLKLLYTLVQLPNLVFINSKRDFNYHLLLSIVPVMTNQTFENLKTNNNWRRKYLCWQPLHWWQYSTTEGKYEISQTIIYFIQTTSSSSTLWSSSSVSSSVSSSDSAALLLLHLYILLFNVLFSHALVNNLQCHTQGHRIHCTTQS